MLKKSVGLLLGVLCGFLLWVPAVQAQKKVFTFGWPAGLEAEVQYKTEVVREMEHRNTRTSSFRTAGLRVEAAPDSEGEEGGLLLHFEGSTPEKLRPSTLQRFLDALPAFAATVEVTENGELKEARLSPEVVEWGKTLLEKLPEDEREREWAKVDEMAVASRWKDLWRLQIEQWIGKPFRKKSRFTFERQVPFPSESGMLELEAISLVIGKAPCREGERRKKCIQVETVERVKPSTLPLALQGAPGTSYEKTTLLAMERRFAAVVEPKTLLPHGYTLHHTLELDPEIEGSLKREEITRRWSFNYE